MLLLTKALGLQFPRSGKSSFLRKAGRFKNMARRAGFEAQNLQFWSPKPQFWRPRGVILAPWGSLWASFWPLGQHPGTLWGPFRKNMKMGPISGRIRSPFWDHFWHQNAPGSPQGVEKVSFFPGPFRGHDLGRFFYHYRGRLRL